MAFKTFFIHQALHSAGSFFEPVTRVAGQVTNAVVPNEMPSPEVLFDIARRGWISEYALTNYCLLAGITVDPSGDNAAIFPALATPNLVKLWNQVYTAGQELPTVENLATMRNRGLISAGAHDTLLRMKNFYTPRVRDDLSQLRFEIPGSSDLVRFSVRHVFEPELVKHLGYNDEFRPILDMWHRFQGLNYPIFSGPFVKQVSAFERELGLEPGTFLQDYVAQDLSDPTWAQAFWWSHWVLPSPTQGYEMLFRLNPDRNPAFDPPEARGINFGERDLALLLRANDYPPFYRDKLASIAHRIPGIRFLRQLRSTGVFNRADVVDLLRRQGYSEGYAEVLATAVEKDDRDRRRRAIEQQAKGQLAKYWELGIIESGDYQALLEEHGMTPDDAGETVQLAELDLHGKRAGRIVDFTRRRFLVGELSEQVAATHLRQAGIIEQRISQYLDDWRLDLKTKFKHVGAQKAVKWACDGIISLAELQARLANLGYQPGDISGLAAEATLCSAARAARALAAGARAEEKLQRSLKQIQRDGVRAIQAARRQLASHGSPAQLRKWYCQGHVGQSELYSRLRFLGWPDADITRLISDCKQISGTPGAGRGGKTGGANLPGGGP